ncbi:MAG: hypothetical protein ACFE9L_20530 [Candidatus Hodarchaeota archaeon]
MDQIKENVQMTEKLSTKDLKLLKGYFNKNIHRIIEEHKNTSLEILKLLIKRPKSSLDLFSPYLIAIIILFPTLLVSILGSEYLIENYIAKNSSIFSLFWGLILGGILSWFQTIRSFKNDVKEEEDRWLVYEKSVRKKNVCFMC